MQVSFVIDSQIVSEYDQVIPESQTADNPVAPRGRAAQPGSLDHRHIMLEESYIYINNIWIYN